MKKIIGEFKKFITRGNVVDMAVGVLVGSSFTAIVNGLSNFILKPIINFFINLLMGEDALSEFYIFLKKVPTTEDVLDEAGKVIGTVEIPEVPDLTKSIYMDMGAFITAIINFILIAVILFVIVKIINKFREENKEFTDKLKKYKLTKEQKKALKARGIKRHDKKAVKAYLEEEKRLAEEAEAAKKAEEEEKARLERLANPTTEDLLKLILSEMQSKNAVAEVVADAEVEEKPAEETKAETK